MNNGWPCSADYGQASLNGVLRHSRSSGGFMLLFVFAIFSVLTSTTAWAQVKASGAPATAATPGVPALGTAGVNCVISAVNRTAIVETEKNYCSGNMKSQFFAYATCGSPK